MTVYQQVRRMSDMQLREAKLRNDEVLSWVRNNDD